MSALPLRLLLCFAAVTAAGTARAATVSHSVDAVLYGGDKVGRLSRPSGLFFVPETGRLYVADPGNQRLVAFDIDAREAIAALKAGGDLKNPVALVRTGTGQLFVIDRLGAKPAEGVLRVDPAAKTVDKVRLDARPNPFSRPTRLALAPDGRIYVLDAGLGRIVVLSAEGAPLKTFALSGVLRFATDVRVTRKGELLLACPAQGAVFLATEAGRIVKRFGEARDDQPALTFPNNAVLDEERGLLYVADSHAHRIVVFGLDGKRVAEIGAPGAREGELWYPGELAIGPNGALVVLDAGNQRIVIYRRSEG